MRKFAIALVAAGCCSYASAQSSVQIYGTADLGMTYQTHRGLLMTNSAWNPSQLGLRGQEDLGGGLRAFFDMGTSISINTGLPASQVKFFDRNSFVGLSDSRWGIVAFGRQLNTLSETFFVADPLGTRNGWTNMNVRFGYLVGPGPTIVNNFGPSPGVAGANLDRVDNAAKYIFRSESTGVSGALMVAAGEGNGGARGALLGWDRGPLRTRAAFMDYHDAIGTPLRAYAAGVSYGITKTVTLRATYTTNAIDSGLLTATRPYGNMKTRVGSVGAIWAWSPSLNLTFAYYRGGRTQDAAAKQVAQKFYFVPEYFLSKRTSLYLIALHERLNATGSALDTGTPLPAGTRTSSYLGLGVSHSF